MISRREFIQVAAATAALSTGVGSGLTRAIAQQRLTEKQWSANLTKMIGWGAEVPESKKETLLAYLVKNFGPDNDRFEPVITRPAGR